MIVSNRKEQVLDQKKMTVVETGGYLFNLSG